MTHCNLLSPYGHRSNGNFAHVVDRTSTELRVVDIDRAAPVDGRLTFYIALKTGTEYEDRELTVAELAEGESVEAYGMTVTLTELEPGTAGPEALGTAFIEVDYPDANWGTPEEPPEEATDLTDR